MNLAIRIKAETLRTVAFGGIAAGYNPLGAVYGHPIRVWHIINASDEPIIWSWDGINDMGYVAANGFTLYDVSSNQIMNLGAQLSQGDRTYIRAAGALPTLGAVYLTLLYGASL